MVKSQLLPLGGPTKCITAKYWVNSFWQGIFKVNLRFRNYCFMFEVDIIWDSCVFQLNILYCHDQRELTIASVSNLCSMTKSEVPLMYFPQIHLLKPSLQKYWGMFGVFGRLICTKGRVFMNTISDIIREAPDRSFAPSIMWGHRQGASCYQKEDSYQNQPSWHLDLKP